jgi:DNA-directed RNA polymerase specialized sigma24 family protein
MDFAKHVNYATKIGAGNQAEDIVQEAYLKCLRLNKMDEPYIYSAIKSLTADIYRLKKKITKVEISNLENLSQEQIETLEWTPTKFEEIENTLVGLHWFHIEVFKIYTTEIQSIRKLAKATNIGERTLFNSIKLCKTKLRENQKELEIQLLRSQQQ